MLLEEGFTRDVTQLGQARTGDLEIRIQTAAGLERAQPILLRSYQGRDFSAKNSALQTFDTAKFFSRRNAT